MPGTTTHIPISVNDLINKLKLLPGDYKIQVTNSDGDFYIDNLTADADECIVILNLIKIPE